MVFRNATDNVRRVADEDLGLKRQSGVIQELWVDQIYGQYAYIPMHYV
ncbi:hypothetical protein RchiOBHm_Chr5g0026111 [Rosa chinensis]|uniref:Uncharacterized protein n=1 Tax=Rosa chinensis TaxID=74649 RepID=A0A2P6Q8R4_ROSCH|nr:hypothetical protein RchiOBHm_Chr5g0026111 [Rosa chinensis]